MSQVYNVEISYLVEDNDQETSRTAKFTVPQGATVLQAALDANIDLPSSCCAGVCTTCAAKILEGEVSQADSMGVSEELQAEGYALLCVASPLSDLKIVANKEDEVYDRQFGNQ